MKSNFNKHHPSIWLGGRENNFFNMHWDKGLDWYASKFPAKTRAHILYGEKTPSYIYGLDQPNVTSERQHCHQRMHQVVPDAKLILCLRNPIDRAFSHWNMERTHTKGYELTFTEAIRRDWQHMQDPSYQRFTDYDFVQKGFYIDYIENLLAYYPREQLHICFTEELKSDVENQYNLIYEFLNLPAPENPSYSVRSTDYNYSVEEEARQELSKLYVPYNERLFEFIGREVPAWLV